MIIKVGSHLLLVNQELIKTRFHPLLQPKRRHDERINILYVDNHVEAEHQQKLFFSKSPEILRLWNRDNKPHINQAE